MKKILARLGVFFIGFPVCLVVIVLLPQKSHLAANLLITTLSALGAMEFSTILSKKGLAVRKTEAFFYGFLPPASATLAVSFGLSFIVTPFVIMALAVWIMARGFFTKTAVPDGLAARAAGGFAVLFYPSLFISWAIFLNSFPNATFLLVFFISVVVITDSLGWLFGVLFGAGNRGFIPVSPNKSIAGYLGSFTGALAVSFAAAYFLPGLFASMPLPASVSALILGIGTAVVSQAGDLAESALKRSAGVKDSGEIMPGRGGILDSIDSLVFAAPFFYFCFRALRGAF